MAGAVSVLVEALFRFADQSLRVGCGRIVLSYEQIFDCNVYIYSIHLYAMIKSFRHKGIERFFRKGSKAGITPAHASRLSRQLKALDQSDKLEDMDFPGWDFHSLGHNLSGHWAVKVGGNWRLTFAFEGDDAILVDYQDYH